MIKQYQDILGTQVMSFDDGHLIAVVSDLIIHPDTGKIEAAWVKPVSMEIPDGILLVEDIIEWKSHIFIRNESKIAEPDDIIKITEILQRDTPIIGNRVKSESGTRWGRVTNLDFDTDRYYIRYLFAQRSFLGINLGKKIFHYDDIIEVLPETIVIKDRDAKEASAKSLMEDNQALLDSR